MAVCREDISIRDLFEIANGFVHLACEEKLYMFCLLHVFVTNADELKTCYVVTTLDIFSVYIQYAMDKNR